MKEQMKEIVVEEKEKKESKVKAFVTKAKYTVKRNWKSFAAGAAVATLASLAYAAAKYGNKDEELSDPVIENELDVFNHQIESDNNSQEAESE